MAFSDFKTISEVLERFRIRYIESDGTWWQFGRLIADAFTQNRTSFGVDNLPFLFGAVDAVFKATTEAAATSQSANSA